MLTHKRLLCWLLIIWVVTAVTACNQAAAPTPTAVLPPTAVPTPAVARQYAARRL